MKLASALPYHQCRARSLRFVRDKVVYWNQQFNFSYKKISIRDQSTRWGSCSRSGTISFNYRLLFLPEHLADYVVVHELCHIAEMNHSRAFWKLVATVLKDYRVRRHELRQYLM